MTAPEPIPHLLVITPDGETHSEEIDAMPKLDRLMKLCDGYVQDIPGWHTFHGQPCRAWCNSTGEPQRLQPNLIATREWFRAYEPAERILLGTVVVVVAPIAFQLKNWIPSQ